MKDRKNIIRTFSAKRLTRGAAIAAIYAVLTFASSMAGLGNGALQIRISEAMCVLPAFMPEAVPGLYIGCIIGNMLSGCVIWDVIFGSLATLIGALGAYFIAKLPRRFFPLLPLPTVFANSLIVPLVLMYAYGSEGTYLFFLLSVGAGEILSAFVLGIILYRCLYKSKLWRK